MVDDPDAHRRGAGTSQERRSGIPRSRSPWGSQARLAGRRIWDIGDWGGASEQIGKHWEESALRELQRLVGTGWVPPDGGRSLARDDCLTGVLGLANQPDLARAIAATGLQNPDAILLGSCRGGGLVLQAVDFKWSLETASYRQISASALRALVESAVDLPPAIGDALGASRSEGASDGPAGQGSPASAEDQAGWSYVDGFFFAPGSESNRQFLASVENRCLERPLEPEEAVLVPVEGEAFFGSLVGWDLGVKLAGLDRSVRLLAQLDGAERYYRLGAGVRGALITLHTGLFAEGPAAIDADAVFEELRQALRARTSADLIAYLNRRLAHRAGLLKRLRDLWRTPYRLAELRTDLGRRGIELPETEEIRGPTRRIGRVSWTEIHKAVAQAHRAAVNSAGRELVARGQPEPEAITALERRRAEFAARARADAHRRIDLALAGS